MTIQQAIEKAIEGGWKKELYDVQVDSKEGVFFQEGLYHFKFPEVFLDPLFWQSLGKSMGWEEVLEVKNYQSISYEYWKGRPEWIFRWHLFIDHLAEEKDADSFFESL